ADAILKLQSLNAGGAREELKLRLGALKRLAEECLDRADEEPEHPAWYVCGWIARSLGCTPEELMDAAMKNFRDKPELLDRIHQRDEAGDTTRMLEMLAKDEYLAQHRELAERIGLNHNAGCSNEAMQKVNSGMKWPDVAQRLDRLRLQGEPFSSQQKLAEQLGCSAATINRAIRETPRLKPWACPGTEPKVSRLAGPIFDGCPQSREPTPGSLFEEEDIDRAMAYVAEEAKPTVKRELMLLPPESRHRIAELLANDPDSSNKIWRKK
ncbi:MAG: hypothetical protein L0Z53_12295, partial [Acidobacteriales bacterium]|nr:hypothetical protein [Terriglobales bacterium]